MEELTDGEGTLSTSVASQSGALDSLRPGVQRVPVCGRSNSEVSRIVTLILASSLNVWSRAQPGSSYYWNHNLRVV
jgi:hypothetical protein